MSVPRIVRYKWGFGDGTISTAKSPNHVYRMPGTYDVFLIQWDNFGNAYAVLKEDYIRVYDWTYEAGGLHVSYSTECLRHAITPLQGIGACKWGGDHWVYPEAYVGTCRGLSETNEALSLVLHNRTGEIYRIGIKELWQDRVDSYGGFEIPTSWKLREYIARAGEYQQIKHSESHVYLRPFKETYRNNTGYDGRGYREGFRVGANLYKEGDPSSFDALEQVPKFGDYTFIRDDKANRMQFGVHTNTSAFRCVGIQSHIVDYDWKPGPEKNRKSETNWCSEFLNSDLWITRDSVLPLLDRVEQIEATGTYDSLVTGPDGEGESAIAFAAAGGINYNIDVIAGDFSLFIWLSDLLTLPGTIWTIGGLTVTIEDLAGDTIVRWNDGTNNITQLLQWDRVEWMLLCLQKNGEQLRVFENDSMVSRFALAGSLSYGGAVGICTNTAVRAFNMQRVLNAVEADAVRFFYNDVLNNGGNGGLLPPMR